MKIAILSENRTNHPECMAEFGLSVYIEAGDRKILFDFGASDLYLQNARGMKVDLTQVDVAVISHGHYDHTGGVPSFCEINKKAKIYIHEKAFSEAYGMENGKLDKEPCSILWTKEQHRQVRDRLELTNGATWLSEDIVISGTIPMRDDEKLTEDFYIRNEDGSMTLDPMDHEQFLAIRERDRSGKSRGIFIISGCSHTGVIPCLRYARALFPEDRILGLLAGMHLYPADTEARKDIVGRIVAEEIEYLLPVHCTGILAICDLRNLKGENCLPAGAGDKYVF